MRRLWSVLAGVVLVLPGVVACGGADEGSLGSGETATSSGAVTSGATGELRPVEVVAAEGLALFDDDLAVTAVALLAAADRGYSPLQIDRAVGDGTLTEAGGVVTGAGEVVASEWPAEDFIQGKPPVVAGGGEEGAAAPADRGVELVAYVVGRAGTVEPVTFDGLRATFEADALAALDAAVPAESVTTTTLNPMDSAGDRYVRSLDAIGMIAELHRQGYTVEQIILGVIGGLARFNGMSFYIMGEAPEGRTAPVEPAPVEPAPVEPAPDLSAYSGVYLGIYPGASVDQDGNIVQRVDGELRITVGSEGHVEGTFAYALENAETFATFTGEVSQDGTLTAGGSATTTLANGREVSGPIVLNGTITGATFQGVSRSQTTGFEVPITATRS